MSEKPDSYEAPSVEEIDNGGYPITTVAGASVQLD
jgi:hypothetical protein